MVERVDMSTSQNGFDVLGKNDPRLYTWKIPANTGEKIREIPLRNGSAGFLLIHLAMWFDDTIEDVDGGLLDDWGYAYRPIRGYSTTMSNHASGTAVDLNATRHVLGQENTFSAAEERRIRHRVNDFFDGTIRWGGEYRGRKDEMHWEIDASMAHCERVARRLMSSPRGLRILRRNPTQRAVILS